MANCLLRFYSRILKVRILYCKKTKNKVAFFCLPYSGTWVHKRVRVNFKVPEYGSRFPSTGPLLGFYLGPGSRVRVQVPEYVPRFPSTDFEKIIEITSFLQISLKMFFHFWIVIRCCTSLPCCMGHRIPIWAQKYWF
jgi:hypothetical protein